MSNTNMAKSASLLAVAGMIEYGLQVLLPILLVRFLTPAEFAEYRMIWLLAGTALALFPLYLPHSLFYFLPRASDGGRAAVVGNTLAYLLVAGIIAATLTGTLLHGFAHHLPETFDALHRYGGWVPAFVGIWVVASMLDILPTADGKPVLQAALTIILATLRTIGIGLVAVLTRDLAAVIMAVCAFAAVRMLLIPVYAKFFATERQLTFDWTLLRKQLIYAMPFALGNGLYLLRFQTDQWIVASFLLPTAFAMISIAGVAHAFTTLIKQPIRNTILPELSRLAGSGELLQARQLLIKSNTALILIVLPLLALMLTNARDLIRLVYTSLYIDAAPLMQIYLLGEVLGLFGTGYLLTIFDKGRLSVIISVVCLVLSIALSLLGISLWGLNGAVLGSVISMLFGEFWALNVIARELQCRLIDLVPRDLLVPVLSVVLLACVLSVGTTEMLLSNQPPMSRLACSITLYTAIVLLGGHLSGLWRTIHALASPRPA